MTIDRTLWLTALGAIGAALVTFPFLPGNWPNPLPEGDRLSATDMLQLKMAAARVDLAFDRGDVGGFDAAVTVAHRARLARELEAVQRPLDARTLKAFAVQREHSLADMLRMPLLASDVRGGRAAVAMGRPQGDGAHLLEFVWDGRKMRFDGQRHVPVIGTASRAQALVTDAVAKKSP